MIEGYFKKGKAKGFARWIWADGLSFEGFLDNFKQDGTGKRILGDQKKDVVETIVYKKGKIIKSFLENSETKKMRHQIEDELTSKFCQVHKTIKPRRQYLGAMVKAKSKLLTLGKSKSKII